MDYLDYRRDFLAHHGIKGQKWGVRRFQNEDGSLTNAGEDRYLDGDKKPTNRFFKSANKIRNDASQMRSAAKSAKTEKARKDLLDSADALDQLASKQESKGKEKEDRVNATRKMVSSKEEHLKNTSKGKLVGSTLLVGLKGTSNRNVYDIARASGEGKAKSFLRSVFDLKKSQLATIPTKILIEYSFRKSGANNTLSGQAFSGAAQLLAGVGLDIAITSHEHKKGRAASLQERALRKRYYSN